MEREPIAPTLDKDPQGRRPYPENGFAERGVISLWGVPISEALHWIEDGHYVFRSTEFDVIAGAPTPEEAVTRFVDLSEELARYLADVAHSDDATHEELDLAILLLTRFHDAYEAYAREQANARLRRQIAARLRGRRGDRHPAWAPNAAQQTSRQPVAV